jgi:anti-anti-sigma factor
MEFEIRGNNGVVRLQGSLNAVHVDRVRREFKSGYDANPGVTHMVLDFSKVTMVDSAGLGALIALLKHVSQRGGI